MTERIERPTFKENFLRPISYTRELREKGIQKRDLPILGTVALLNICLILLASGNGKSLLENAGLVAATNLVVHTIISLAASDAMPPGGIVGG